MTYFLHEKSKTNPGSNSEYSKCHETLPSRNSNVRIRTVFDHLPCIMISLDKSTFFHFANVVIKCFVIRRVFWHRKRKWWPFIVKSSVNDFTRLIRLQMLYKVIIIDCKRRVERKFFDQIFLNEKSIQNITRSSLTHPKYS